MKRGLIFLFLILFSVSFAYSHGGEEEEYLLDHSELYPINQLAAVGYGSLIFGILVAIILLYHKKMNNFAKKAVYFLIVITIGFVTLYLVLTTLHLNIISITKGPIHWHADFEIWACDKELELKEPEGLSNKQGVNLMHAHNDKRIHVEGVIVDEKAASLGAFFYAVGGSITNDGFSIVTDYGTVSYHDGDLCNGLPGQMHAFVNGNKIENPRDYIISPYEKIPPGDRVKIVFTEKPAEEINPNIG